MNQSFFPFVALEATKGICTSVCVCVCVYSIVNQIGVNKSTLFRFLFCFVFCRIGNLGLGYSGFSVIAWFFSL